MSAAGQRQESVALRGTSGALVAGRTTRRNCQKAAKGPLHELPPGARQLITWSSELTSRSSRWSSVRAAGVWGGSLSFQQLHAFCWSRRPKIPPSRVGSTSRRGPGFCAALRCVAAPADKGPDCRRDRRPMIGCCGQDRPLLTHFPGLKKAKSAALDKASKLPSASPNSLRPGQQRKQL